MHKGMVTERLRLLVGDNESELLGRDVNADAEPPGVHEGRLDCYRLRCCWEGRDADAGHDLDAEEGERRRAAGKEAQSRSCDLDGDECDGAEPLPKWPRKRCAR